MAVVSTTTMIMTSSCTTRVLRAGGILMKLNKQVRKIKKTIIKQSTSFCQLNIYGELEVIG